MQEEVYYKVANGEFEREKEAKKNQNLADD
jgi:hypothetical protein